MKPAEILRDARDMAEHYKGDRLRLTGAEVLEFSEALARAVAEVCAREAQNQHYGGDGAMDIRALSPDELLRRAEAVMKEKT